MPDTLWSSKIVNVGRDAREMLDAGVLIIFADPVPDALAEVSIVHSGAQTALRPIRAGDILDMGGQIYRLDEVGPRVQENLQELGHAVIYVNMPDQQMLPGAIKASGQPVQTPAVGDTLAFLSA